MARPGNVPITRLRFRGRGDVLNTLCREFRNHPRQALTAADLAEFTHLQFANVHERLTETPELFVTLPQKAKMNTRYRLTSAVERMNDDETRVFIDAQTRRETWLAIGAVSAILAIAGVAGFLGAKY